MPGRPFAQRASRAPSSAPSSLLPRRSTLELEAVALASSSRGFSLDVRRSPTPSWEPGPLGKRSWACKAADKRLQPCLQGAQAAAWTAKCLGLQSTGPHLQGGPGPRGLQRLLLSNSGALPTNEEGTPQRLPAEGSTKAPRPAACIQAGPHPGSHGARPSPTATGTRLHRQAVKLTAYSQRARGGPRGREPSPEDREGTRPAP